MMWLLSLAWGGAATDAEIVAAVSTLYGQEVPAAGVCIERVDPGKHWESVAAVGTRRGAKGCGLVGVMVGDELIDAKRAATRAGALSKLSPADRAEALGAWTTQVLLAFETVDGKARAEPKATETVVHVTFWQHADTAEVALHTEGAFAFDSQGELKAQEREGGKAYDLDFIAYKDVLDGVTEPMAKAAIDSKGSTLAKCFWKAFALDPSIQGAVKMRFKVSDGTAHDVVHVATDRDPRMAALATCYGHTLDETTWPADANGTVNWVFAGVRNPI